VGGFVELGTHEKSQFSLITLVTLMMGFFTRLASIAAPLFLIASPVLSYADQAISMHRAKSSAGFSLDIPLIMLVASMFR
jgi:hypothetical protein